MQRVLSLPELPSRTQPPSVHAPSGTRTKRSFGVGSSFKSRSAELDAEAALRMRSGRKPQRQRVVAPRGSVVPSDPLSDHQLEQDEQWLQEEQQRAQELLRIKPKEAARSPGRKLLASIASPAHELETFRSPLVGFELRLAAALKDAAEPSPTEERAGACFAVLRGLSEHVAVEFRPLIERLTLELQHAVYDRSAPDESSHFEQLRHARAHAANLTADLAAEREDTRRLRAELVRLTPLELHSPPPHTAPGHASSRRLPRAELLLHPLPGVAAGGAQGAGAPRAAGAARAVRRRHPARLRQVRLERVGAARREGAERGALRPRAALQGRDHARVGGAPRAQRV